MPTLNPPEGLRKHRFNTFYLCFYSLGVGAWLPKYVHFYQVPGCRCWSEVYAVRSTSRKKAAWILNGKRRLSHPGQRFTSAPVVYVSAVFRGLGGTVVLGELEAEKFLIVDKVVLFF